VSGTLSGNVSAQPARSLSPRASRLAAALAALPRRGITLAELWQLFDRVDPVSATSPTRRAELATILAELEAGGVIGAPSPRSLDRTQDPPLPRRVKLAGQTSAGRGSKEAGSATSVAWRPELAWATSVATRLSAGQLEALRRINAWLRDTQPSAEVPLRERSYEIFGDEKQLDRLLGTSLFGPDRLSLGLLRARRTRPPLPARRLGSGPLLLVVENSDTFDTLARLLADQPGRVGWVAWGAGQAFEASVLSIAELPQATEIHYYGDLDATGLRIPAAASQLASSEGLPEVRPADELYRILLARGSPQRTGAEGRLYQDRAGGLASWLPPELRSEVAALLAAGYRIPQEAVGFELLARSQAWRRSFQ
jgi:hypothetical protein